MHELVLEMSAVALRLQPKIVKVVSLLSMVAGLWWSVSFMRAVVVGLLGRKQVAKPVLGVLVDRLIQFNPPSIERSMSIACMLGEAVQVMVCEVLACSVSPPLGNKMVM